MKASLSGRGRRWFLLVLVAALLAFPQLNLSAQMFRHGAKAKANSPQPEVRIPVGGLGYMPPGTLPAFDSAALVGLYYIDVTHLLFTFDVKGLLRRDDRCSGNGTQRRVRAVVLELPSGKVEKQAEWELYDFSDYLWSLGNGQFLLRSCSRLEIVGAALDPRPLIEPSGAVVGIGFSPDRSIAVIEQYGQGPASRPKSAHPLEYPPARKVDVDFIRLHPLAEVGRAQILAPAAVPIVAQGILEVLPAPHGRWVVDLQPFQGQARKIATLGSTCQPRLTALTDTVVLAGVCSGAAGGRIFQGLDLSGKLLWRIQPGPDRYNLQFLLTRNGAHFATETLHATEPLGPLDPVGNDLIDAEVIDIYDTATGMRIGGFRTTPVYTAGKNADFSPDGTHMAVLHNGAIEIYTLKELGKTR